MYSTPGFRTPGVDTSVPATSHLATAHGNFKNMKVPTTSVPVTGSSVLVPTVRITVNGLSSIGGKACMRSSRNGLNLNGLTAMEDVSGLTHIGILTLEAVNTAV